MTGGWIDQNHLRIQLNKHYEKDSDSAGLISIGITKSMEFLIHRAYEGTSHLGVYK